MSWPAQEQTGRQRLGVQAEAQERSTITQGPKKSSKILRRKKKNDFILERAVALVGRGLGSSCSSIKNENMKSVEKSAVGLWPSHCASLQPQRSAVIKAALETPHNCSTVIYMQLKFHVKQDKADGRRAEQRSSGRRRKRGG